MEESLPLRRSTRKSVIAKTEELTPSKRNISTPVKTEHVTPSRRTRASSTTPKKSLIQVISTPKKMLTVLNEEDTPKKRKISNINVSNHTPKKGDKECTPRKLELKKSPKRNINSSVNIREETKESNLTPKKGIKPDDFKKLVDGPKEMNVAEDRPLTRAKRKTITEKQVIEVETLSGEILISNGIKGKKSVNFADFSYNKSDLKEGGLSSTALVPKIIITDCVKVELKEPKKLQYIDKEKESIEDFKYISPVKAEDVAIKSPKKIPEQYKSTSERSLVLNGTALANARNSCNSEEIQRSPKDFGSLPISNDKSSPHFQKELENQEHIDSEKSDTCSIKITATNSKITGVTSENLPEMEFTNKKNCAIIDVDNTFMNTEVQRFNELESNTEGICVNNKEDLATMETRSESLVKDIVTNKIFKSDLSSTENLDNLQANELLSAVKSNEQKISITYQEELIPNNQKNLENVEGIRVARIDHVCEVKNDTCNEMCKLDKLNDVEIDKRNSLPIFSHIIDESSDLLEIDHLQKNIKNTKLTDDSIVNRDDECNITKDLNILDNPGSLVLSDKKVLLTTEVNESHGSIKKVVNKCMLTQIESKTVTKTTNEEKTQEGKTKHMVINVNEGNLFQPSSIIIDEDTASKARVLDSKNEAEIDEVLNEEKTQEEKTKNMVINVNEGNLFQSSSVIVDEDTASKAKVLDSKNESEIDEVLITQPTNIVESNDIISTNEEDKNLTEIDKNYVKPKQYEAVANTTPIVRRELFTSKNLVSITEPSTETEPDKSNVVSPSSHNSDKEKSSEIETFEQEINQSILMLTSDTNDHSRSTDSSSKDEKGVDKHEIEAEQFEKKGCDFLEIFENKKSPLKGETSMKLESNRSFFTENCIKESFNECNAMSSNQKNVTNEIIKPDVGDKIKHESKDTNIWENSDSKVVINVPMLTQTSNGEDSLDLNDLAEVKEQKLIVKPTVDTMDTELLESKYFDNDINSEIGKKENLLTAKAVDSANNFKTKESSEALLSKDTGLNNLSTTNVLEQVENEKAVTNDNFDIKTSTNLGEKTTLNCETNDTDCSTKEEMKVLTLTSKVISNEDSTIELKDPAKNVTGCKELFIEEIDKHFADSHLFSDSKKPNDISEASVEYKNLVNHISESTCISKNDVAKNIELTCKAEGLDEILMSPKDFLNSDEESLVDDKYVCMKITVEENLEDMQDFNKSGSENSTAEEDVTKSNVFCCQRSNINSVCIDTIENESVLNLIDNTTIKQNLSKTRDICEESHLIDKLNKSNIAFNDSLVKTEVHEKESTCVIDNRTIAINEVESNITSDIKNNELTEDKSENVSLNAQVFNSNNKKYFLAVGSDAYTHGAGDETVESLVNSKFHKKDNDSVNEISAPSNYNEDTEILTDEEISKKETCSVGSVDTLFLVSENNFDDTGIISGDKREYLDKSYQETSKSIHKVECNTETSGSSIQKKKFKRIILNDCISDNEESKIELDKKEKKGHSFSGEKEENDRRYNSSESDSSNDVVEIKASNLKKHARNNDDKYISENKISGKTFIDFEAEVGEEWSDDYDGTSEEASSSASSVTSLSGFFDREAVERKKKRSLESESSDSSDYVGSVPRLFHSPTGSWKNGNKLESDLILHKRPKLEKSQDIKYSKKPNNKIEKSVGFNKDLKNIKERNKVYKEFTKPGVFVVSSFKKCQEKPKQSRNISYKKQLSRFPDSVGLSKEDDISDVDCLQCDDSILRGFVVTKIQHDKVKKNVRKTAVGNSGSVNQNKGWKIKMHSKKNKLSPDKPDKKKNHNSSSLEATLILHSTSSTSKAIKSALKRSGIGAIDSVKFVKPTVAIVKFKKEDSLRKALDLYGKLTINDQPVYILEGSSSS